MSKINSFLTNTQPENVLSIFFKIIVYLSMNALIQKVLYKRREFPG